MSDIAKQITGLSVEKRQLLDRYLKNAGLNLTSAIIVPQPRNTDKFPLSFAQERLWFLDQLEPNRPIYNLPDTHLFKGPLNLEALQRSLSEIVRRHELLRTTFQMVDGKPVQVIAPPQPFELPVLDISHLTEAERTAKAQQLADEDSTKPFDLSRGPLFRVQLVRLAPEQHWLLFTMHHIISDGWSLQVMARELSTLYEAYRLGQDSPLPQLPIQYADFAVWQREWLQGEVLEKQLDYWRKQLGGDVAHELELPFDHARPARQSFRGGAENNELNAAVSRRLKEIARGSGATLFMTLMAAFNVLLWRCTGQDDLLVGTPIANRTRKETENLIGFFVNTLVLRTKIKASSTFRELLEQVRENTVAAYDHQDVPFEKLVEELHPNRSLSHHPLFQVLFALQDAGQLDLTGLELTWMDTQNDIAKFDLSFYVNETNTGLYSWIEYDRDLFERDTIVRMLKHFEVLVEGIAANPDAKLSELEILTKAERAQLLEWNQTTVDYDRDLCVHQIFEAQVARQPQAVAIIDVDEQINYKELNRRANRLAHFLRSKGVGPDVCVGVLLERSLEFDVAVLGILKAGGAYVPLDVTYPRMRLQFMLDDAGTRLLLTRQKHSEVVPETSEAVYLDHTADLFANESAENPENLTTHDNVAYVMYTSGSTGQPKGVAVTHQAINRLVCNTDCAQLDNSYRLGQGSNVSFDAATFEIWGGLLNGSTLIVLPKEIVLSPLELKRAIAKQQIDALFLTTALFNQMAQSVSEAFASLRYLLFGGEASDAQAAKRVLERGKPQHLLHLYGPTEGTTFTTWYEVNEVAAGARTLPIGRPLSNTETWVLDQQMQLVPVGVAGELYVGGDGIAREYLGEPALTAEKFVPHPYSRKPGARLYRTGDMARYLSDGNLEFLKRRDHQVKIRGFRVELGEIEAALDQYWAITESVVIDRDDLGGGTRLVAYIVPEEGVEPTAAELHAFLKEKIPSYMIPSIFVTMEEIPLTPNGKVNRRELPVPEFTEDATLNFVAPRTPLEETLAAIWRETLSLPQVGVESNFFDLGGHSLLATRVISQIRENVGVELPLRVLFESPTIAGLAQHLETVQSKDTQLKQILSMLQNVENISEEEVTALLAQAEAAG
ncbi:MAG TPA: amino acid adenylation domain-containing protein [Pyrinomonadaceae bacterium]